MAKRDRQSTPNIPGSGVVPCADRVAWLLNILGRLRGDMLIVERVRQGQTDPVDATWYEELRVGKDRKPSANLVLLTTLAAAPGL